MARGLLSEVPRKGLRQLAEAAGHPTPDRLQGFLAKAAWDADSLCDRVRGVPVTALATDDGVLIADGTGDLRGTKSAGVRRPHTGTAARIENAQVSMHLSYGSRLGRALIDRELYLARGWADTAAEHARRCVEQGTPPERAAAVLAEAEPARRMLERARDAQVPFAYFLADEAYGQCRTLRARLRSAGCTTCSRFPTAKSRRCRTAAPGRPANRTTWSPRRQRSAALQRLWPLHERR